MGTSTGVVADVLTAVWLEAFLPAATPSLMAPTMPAIAASRLADGVLDAAAALVIEVCAWRASSLCDGLGGEGKVRAGRIRKASHRSVAPLKEESMFLHFLRLLTRRTGFSLRIYIKFSTFRGKTGVVGRKEKYMTPSVARSEVGC